jgi:hypothetical protein
MTVISLLPAACYAAARMLVTHDQDVTVYSARPDGTVQVIGLRHRTYLLDYGGRRDVVLFGTTFGTGVLTHSPGRGACPAAPGHDEREQTGVPVVP